MKRLTFKLIRGSWMVRFDDEPEVSDLMGGEWVQTPYTHHTSALDVLCFIRRRNPHHDVQLENAQEKLL